MSFDKVKGFLNMLGTVMFTQKVRLEKVLTWDSRKGSHSEF